MAIPISEYIDIASRTTGGVVENRDFSGLVITKNAMKATVPSAYTQVKTDYAAGKAVALTLDDVNACFDDGDLKTFATKYFGYNGGNRKPSILNVALVLAGDTNPVTTFNRVIAESINYGSCTVLGAIGASAGTGVDFTVAQIKAVADANEALDAENVFIVCGKTTDVTALGTNFDGNKYTHVVISADKFGAWMPMAWYASVNYNLANASSTIDFKQFSGETAVVTDAATKTTYDGKHFNYIGKVQVYGTGLSFYQRGENMDGTDLGVVRDSAWLKGLIVVNYFNLQASVTKIPANYVGSAMVRNIVVDAATLGIQNGVILMDKPLTSSMIAEINQYAGNNYASDEVSVAGYYIDTKIVKDGTRYVCQYTLVYAKGDHIGKVEGVHVLV